MKAILATLQEKHSNKDMDKVLDLHGLKGKEASLVIAQQLQSIQEKLIEGSLQPNCEDGYVYCIVTGKGNHGRRPILRPLTERYLLREGYTYTELNNGAGYKVLF
jgi:DNA-nicking Smr family endonuclease